MEDAEQTELVPSQPTSSRLRQLVQRVAAQWFLLGIVAAVALAYAAPAVGRKGGPIRAEYSIKYAAVIIIFLVSGMGLKSRVLAQALLMWKLHIVVQVVSLIIIPAMGYGICALLRLSTINTALVAGLTIALCMPTTISSNVVMTRQAIGNEAAALINATIGNILGIAVSPLLLLLFLGAQTTVPFGKIFLDLTYTVLIPLIVGQLLQYLFPSMIVKLQSTVNLSYISSIMLLLLVYATFCDSFSDSTTTASLTASALASIICLILFLYPFHSFLCYLISQLLHFSRSNTVAIIYCGATKTMALGIPLIGIVYKNDPNIGLYSLPLLIYHATQLSIGAFMTQPLKRWVENEMPF